MCITAITSLKSNKETAKRKKNDDFRSMTLNRTKSNIDTRAEKELAKPIYEPFDDYLEMVIEFGYVCLFASVFPLGAYCHSWRILSRCGRTCSRSFTCTGGRRPNALVP